MKLRIIASLLLIAFMTLGTSDKASAGPWRYYRHNAHGWHKWHGNVWIASPSVLPSAYGGYYSRSHHYRHRHYSGCRECYHHRNNWDGYRYWK